MTNGWLSCRQIIIGFCETALSSIDITDFRCKLRTFRNFAASAVWYAKLGADGSYLKASQTANKITVEQNILLFNKSHAVLWESWQTFLNKCLDYKTKTCHTNYSKTRLEYRTQQPSIYVTMTSSLHWRQKKMFETRLQ